MVDLWVVAYSLVGRKGILFHIYDSKSKANEGVIKLLDAFHKVHGLWKL